MKLNSLKKCIIESYTKEEKYSVTIFTDILKMMEKETSADLVFDEVAKEIDYSSFKL